MASTVLPIVGYAVGSAVGSPQLGALVGSFAGAALSRRSTDGPRINETPAQTSVEGAFRPIIYGTAPCKGNILCTGAVIKTFESTSQGKGGGTTRSDKLLRNFAIRICEGPIGGILRVWEYDRLVYDVRPGSLMLAESAKWKANKVWYLGGETQLPDVFLELNVSGVGTTPAYRGTAYMVAGLEDVTDTGGAIKQYRFEVASSISQASWPGYTWTQVATPTWSSSAALATDGSGKVVSTALGSAGLSWSSTDLTNWTTASIPNGANRVAYGNGYFVAVDNGTNTIVWTMAPGGGWVNDPHTGNIDKDGIAFGNGIFVITAHDTFLGTHKTFTGTGGTGWASHAIGSNVSGKIRFGNGLFVSLQASQVSSSADGVAWTSHAAPYASPADICWSDDLNLWVLVSAGSGGISTSPNLVTWTARTSPAVAWNAITWAEGLGLFAVVGFGATFATSPDGINWTSHATLPSSTYTDIAWEPVLGKFVLVGASTPRIVVSDSVPGTLEGEPAQLGAIVADIARRCGMDNTLYDVSELDDEVDGLVLGNDYRGSDAIDTLRSCYLFDRAEYDKKIHFPKRGKAPVATITIDDLVDMPDESRREQAIELPKAFNLFYQHAASGYATAKATSARSSPDAKSVAQISVEVPVVLNVDQAAQLVQKLHKVAKADAAGEVKFTVPDSFVRLVPSDCIVLNLRGQIDRLRIEQITGQAGMLELTCRHDNLGSYVSDAVGLPIPLPTLPPSTIVGNTTLAVLDIASRSESEDDLHYLVAGSGASPGWYGWTLQRSSDLGAHYTDAGTFTQAGVMGALLDAIPASKAGITDRTNTVRVHLYRSTQTLESITPTQFLSGGGAFALEKADGSYEVLQYLDAVDEGGSVFALSVLHRGLLNSGSAAHAIGAKFVLLSRTSHIPVPQFAWIGQPLTHRAPSFDQADELATAQTATFIGRSQIEWPVARLTLARSVGNVITANWLPRHRLGSDVAPVASKNQRGFRVTFSDGVLPAVIVDTDPLNQSLTSLAFNASALGSPVSVSVSALNRLTGAGPATSGTV